MRRFYYFGCRDGKAGHFLYNEHSKRYTDVLGEGFPTHLLDGTFAPLDRNDPSWKLTHLRFNHHILSILACHDYTIDTRPGSNAAFAVVDTVAWEAEHILAEMRDRFSDCWERLRGVKLPGSEAPVRATAGLERWEDTPDEWTDQIQAAYPTRSGSHDEYTLAMKMVGNRHSKGELVALVNWLLLKNVQGVKLPHEQGEMKVQESEVHVPVSAGMSDFQVQTHSDKHGVCSFPTLQQAFDHAARPGKRSFKITFPLPSGELVKLFWHFDGYCWTVSSDLSLEVRT